MRNPLRLLWLAVLLTPGPGMAQSVFDGTWKVNLSTAKFPEKLDEYLLKDGIYQCKTCVPPIEVQADGKDQKVTAHDTVSDNGLSFTLKMTGDTVEMTSPTGQSYTAKLDGIDAAYHGDPGTTSVSVKKKGPNTIEETDKRDGKVIAVSVMTVSADGQTMKIATDDKLRGTRSHVDANKQ